MIPGTVQGLSLGLAHPSPLYDTITCKCASDARKRRQNERIAGEEPSCDPGIRGYEGPPFALEETHWLPFLFSGNLHWRS